MDIDEKGNMVSHKIAETVICVDERMNYTDVKIFWKIQTKKQRNGMQIWFPCFS